MTVPILLYHQIAIPPAKPMPFRSMFVRPASFRRQMALLKRLGYQGLSLREAVPYIKGDKKGRVVAITFDDGFTNVLENAAPVLQQHGFTATSFVVANQIGGINKWDEHLGIVTTSCMNADQLQRWIGMGHEIGSHTLDHVQLTGVSDKEALRQIAHSREVLKALLGIEVTSFAFPYGEVAAIHRAIAQEVGYSWAVTTERRSAGPADSAFALPRLTIRRADTIFHFLRKILS